MLGYRIGWVAAAAMCLTMVGISRATAATRPDPYVGVWSGPVCYTPRGAEGCGEFTLYLKADKGRICGQHYAATPGAGRMDEGEPGTVLGTINGTQAVVVIQSMRNEARYLATLRRQGAQLVWHIVGKVAAGQDDEGPIFPVDLTLSKSASSGRRVQWKAFQSGECAWPGEAGAP